MELLIVLGTVAVISAAVYVVCLVAYNIDDQGSPWPM